MSATVDIGAARRFMTANARQLERRRFALLVDDDDANAVVAALDAYRNGDGGYGWGLESDLGSPESQPCPAMHAFEVLADLPGGVGAEQAVALCDWLEAHTLADGGLPFACPTTEAASCAPWWLGADPTTSSLQMTTQVAATAHLVARHNEGVRNHPWLARATAWCFDVIGALDEAPEALELVFSVRFLDAVAESGTTEHTPLLERVRQFFPADGVFPVVGGADDEVVRPLDFTLTPGPAADILFARRGHQGRAQGPGAPPAARRRVDGDLSLSLARGRPRMARLRHPQRRRHPVGLRRVQRLLNAADPPAHQARPRCRPTRRQPLPSGGR